MYGSIEYWSTSENVESWYNIKILTDSKPSLENENNGFIMKKANKKKKDDDKKLSKKDWIEVVAAADAIGAFAGLGIASGASAMAVSAGAAIYFDVE